MKNTEVRRLVDPVVRTIWPSSASEIVSNILVLDVQAAKEESMKTFCEQSGLVGTMPAVKGELGALAILEANTEFGGIFVSEDYLGSDVKTFELVRKIRELRPELPVFLRRDSNRGLIGLERDVATMFVHCYTLEDLQDLRAGLEASIFRRLYPNELARGIRDLTKASLEGMFHGCEVLTEAPYLASDRMMPGEFFTLIGINSEWCRGYMTILGPELPLLEVMSYGKTEEEKAEVNFRELNQYISEATNLIWGAFKNKYVRVQEIPTAVQIPIVVNHRHRFISFGSDDPQLCFKYVIRPRGAPEGAPQAWLYQRFVFNLAWNPEAFRAFQSDEPEVFVASGDLEMF